MSVTEVTHESWFGRIGNAFKGMLLGLIFVAGSIALLFWNEGRSVYRYKALNEGARVVVSVEANKIDPANEGKLVCVSGQATTDALLKDEMFNISVNALKLRRTVEMYQWNQQEERKTTRNTGGSTETTITYNYTRQWSETLISSDNFKERNGHNNPTSMPWKSQVQTATPVTLDAFTLSASQVDRIDSYVPYQADAKPAEPVVPANADPAKADPAKPDHGTNNPADSENVKPKPNSPSADNAAAELVAVSLQLKPYNGGFYQGKDPANPEVGDIRVTFDMVKPQDITCVSAQKGNTFAPFPVKSGTIDLLETGIETAEAMFASAQAANKTLTWVLRLVGIVVCFFGFVMLFQPLPVLADVLPIAGTIVGAGTTFISFVLAASVSLVTIGVAWFFYRPLLSIPLFVGAALLLFLLLKRMKKKKVNPS